jgi:putative glutamine amidotransferase
MNHEGVRIGITQRRICATPETWARDALDAHWNEWLASQWGNGRFLAIPNFEDPTRAVRHVEDWGIDLLILSGGEDVGTSPVRDAVERALLGHARAQHLPVLGVCRGMQLMHTFGGGVLVRKFGHAGASHELQGLRQGHGTVNSWHRWCIESAAPHWLALARAPDGTVEAMQHAELPWLGVMWHPERPDGRLPDFDSWLDGTMTTTRRQA